MASVAPLSQRVETLVLRRSARSLCNRIALIPVRITERADTSFAKKSTFDRPLEYQLL